MRCVLKHLLLPCGDVPHMKNLGNSQGVGDGSSTHPVIYKVFEGDGVDVGVDGLDDGAHDGSGSHVRDDDVCGDHIHDDGDDGYDDEDDDDTRVDRLGA